MMPGGTWISGLFRCLHYFLLSFLLLICLLLFLFPLIHPILLLLKSKCLASPILPFPLLLILVLPLTLSIPLFFPNWPWLCLSSLYPLSLICLMVSQCLMVLLLILFPRTFYSLPIAFRLLICWSRHFTLPLL